MGEDGADPERLLPRLLLATEFSLDATRCLLVLLLLLLPLPPPPPVLRGEGCAALRLRRDNLMGEEGAVVGVNVPDKDDDDDNVCSVRLTLLLRPREEEEEEEVEEDEVYGRAALRLRRDSFMGEEGATKILFTSVLVSFCVAGLIGDLMGSVLLLLLLIRRLTLRPRLGRAALLLRRNLMGEVGGANGILVGSSVRWTTTLHSRVADKGLATRRAFVDCSVLFVVGAYFASLRECRRTGTLVASFSCSCSAATTVVVPPPVSEDLRKALLKLSVVVVRLVDGSILCVDFTKHDLSSRCPPRDIVSRPRRRSEGWCSVALSGLSWLACFNVREVSSGSGSVPFSKKGILERDLFSEGE